jgi:ABC-type polysaccharide/polyol phosphate transport system ATPase subunit
MIHLRNVSKYHLDIELGHEVVLRDASFAFPTDRSVAVLGGAKVASTILLMLTGAKVPDKGSIGRGRLRCSPVINSSGAALSLVAQLTALGNIEMLAGRFGADPHLLAALVEGATGLGSAMQLPVRKLDGIQRRSLEIAAISALPFDCYFIDRVHLIEPRLIWRMLTVARLRGSGVIFATDRLPQARRLARSGAFVANGQLHWTENLQETSEAHGQAG